MAANDIFILQRNSTNTAWKKSRISGSNQILYLDDGGNLQGLTTQSFVEVVASGSTESSSYAETSSYALNVSTIDTSSFITFDQTSSLSIESASYAETSSFVSVNSGIENVRVDTNGIKVSGSFTVRSTNITGHEVYFNAPNATNSTASYCGITYGQNLDNPSLSILHRDNIGVANVVEHMRFSLNPGLDQTGFPIRFFQNAYYNDDVIIRVSNTGSALTFRNAPLVVSGGAAIGKNLLVGESVIISGSPAVLSSQTSSMVIESASFSETASYVLNQSGGGGNSSDNVYTINTGEAQTRIYTMYREVASHADGVNYELYTDATSSLIEVPSGSACTFDILVTGADSSATNYWHYKIVGGASRDEFAILNTVIPPTVTAIYEPDVNYDVSIDFVSGSLAVLVGRSGGSDITNVRWSATGTFIFNKAS